jgi:hypothetical protein
MGRVHTAGPLEVLCSPEDGGRSLSSRAELGEWLA